MGAGGEAVSAAEGDAGLRLGDCCSGWYTG